MADRRFTRRREDFVCHHCGACVVGDGYTNHCPHCLWSAHVDIFPGDRAAECGGAMEPISAFWEGDQRVMVHRCVVCGEIRRNRCASNDDETEISRYLGKPYGRTPTNSAGEDQK